MPRSKRNKEVVLTKVKKQPNAEKKDNLIINIQDAVEKFSHAYILEVHNQRNEYLKEVRKLIGAKGQLFMGKNNVMKTALGDRASNELFDEVHQLSERISGVCALL